MNLHDFGIQFAAVTLFVIASLLVAYVRTLKRRRALARLAHDYDAATKIGDIRARKQAMNSVFIRSRDDFPSVLDPLEGVKIDLDLLERAVESALRDSNPDQFSALVQQGIHILLSARESDRTQYYRIKTMIRRASQSSALVRDLKVDFEM